MTQDRFEAFLWSLHLSKPREDEENERKSNTAEYDRQKIKPLCTEIMTACQAHFQPNQNIYGIEWRVHWRKDGGIQGKLGYKLVCLQTLRQPIPGTFLGTLVRVCLQQARVWATHQWWTFCRFLCSVGATHCMQTISTLALPSFENCPKKNIGCCGTMRKNSVGFPQAENNDLLKKAERGDLQWIRNDKLPLVKWMDTWEVSMCSQCMKPSVDGWWNGKWKRLVCGRPRPYLFQML